ncbi:predicted protein [Postia placenta Mad-698-R]|uniref:Uncharacterized protein n=1 Tax=Postia placenta MAD-698-R-SB12 TaxID=670580 RepID=A0A1X6NEY6_9APHY|nr:hypothetical protein POSPLADRAFT_1042450 [Postia placenta MAD-698-R-SB12]EED80855.1 predicted protein [Postia placenta Mad-698-R]OSX67191.1 hypothetical protein POSPLADRAFT_1042450 [Postia placenta MAD-698-R-SB12]
MIMRFAGAQHARRDWTVRGERPTEVCKRPLEGTQAHLDRARGRLLLRVEELQRHKTPSQNAECEHEAYVWVRRQLSIPNTLLHRIAIAQSKAARCAGQDHITAETLLHPIPEWGPVPEARRDGNTSQDASPPDGLRRRPGSRIAGPAVQGDGNRVYGAWMGWTWTEWLGREAWMHRRQIVASRRSGMGWTEWIGLERAHMRSVHARARARRSSRPHTAGARSRQAAPALPLQYQVLRTAWQNDVPALEARRPSGEPCNRVLAKRAATIRIRTAVELLPEMDVSRCARDEDELRTGMHDTTQTHRRDPEHRAENSSPRRSSAPGRPMTRADGAGTARSPAAARSANEASGRGAATPAGAPGLLRATREQCGRRCAKGPREGATGRIGRGGARERQERRARGDGGRGEGGKAGEEREGGREGEVGTGNEVEVEAEAEAAKQALVTIDGFCETSSRWWTSALLEGPDCTNGTEEEEEDEDKGTAAGGEHGQTRPREVEVEAARFRHRADGCSPQAEADPACDGERFLIQYLQGAPQIRLALPQRACSSWRRRWPGVPTGRMYLYARASVGRTSVQSAKMQSCRTGAAIQSGGGEAARWSWGEEGSARQVLCLSPLDAPEASFARRGGHLNGSTVACGDEPHRVWWPSDRAWDWHLESAIRARRVSRPVTPGGGILVADEGDRIAMRDASAAIEWLMEAPRALRWTPVANTADSSEMLYKVRMTAVMSTRGRGRARGRTRMHRPQRPIGVSGKQEQRGHRWRAPSAHGMCVRARGTRSLNCYGDPGAAPLSGSVGALSIVGWVDGDTQGRARGLAGEKTGVAAGVEEGDPALRVACTRAARVRRQYDGGGDTTAAGSATCDDRT